MAIVMASRKTTYWFWRDLRLVGVLLVWAAFAASLFFFFDGDTLLRRAFTAPPPTTTAADEEKIYTGSIRVIPPYGGKCWQMLLDNRTGRMWGYSELDCDAMIRLLAENERNGLGDERRMRTISKAFGSFKR
jgi:hypothetical protein